MPGIVGIIGKGGSEQNDWLLNKMLSRMHREDFSTSGSYANPELGLWVGWVSHEGSFSNCLPVWNETKDICLIFVGENYIDRSELERLRASGHSFQSEDASYLIHLYEELGDNFFAYLNGWFNGVLIDLRKGQIMLFNDRYGLLRLYYHENGNGLYFGSEAKSLLEVLPETRQIDNVSLGELFSCGCVLQGRSLFSSVSVLPGGSLWTFSPREAPIRTTYFDRRSWEELTPLEEGQYYSELKATWERILPRYFGGPQDIALSLTGGVDSRMILAWAKHPPGSLPCYTFGGRYRDCTDVKLARTAASLCGQPHHVLPVGADFLSKFPGMAESDVSISDGAMDVSGAVDLYVQKLARKIAPVRLSGVHGGEILRSIVVFKPRRLNCELFSPEFQPYFDRAARTYASELEGHRLSFIAFKQAPWFMTSKFSVERSQLTFRTPYFDNDLVKLAFRTPAGLIGSNGPSLRLIAEGNPALAALSTDRGLAFRSIPGLTQLGHALQEFTFKAEYAYDYGMPQWLAKIDHLFAPLHLERLWLGRHKFHHFRVYYRDELSNYLKEILLDPLSLSRPYLNGKGLERIVIGHTRGTGNFTTEIHMALTCELIHRLFIDRS